MLAPSAFKKVAHLVPNRPGYYTGDSGKMEKLGDEDDVLEKLLVFFTSCTYLVSSRFGSVRF
jgi:hypothetical protein